MPSFTSQSAATPFVVRPGRIRRAARRMAEERRAATRDALRRLRDEARFGGSPEEVGLSLRRFEA